jgi:hypothetical protein
VYTYSYIYIFIYIYLEISFTENTEFLLNEDLDKFLYINADAVLNSNIICAFKFISLSTVRFLSDLDIIFSFFQSRMSIIFPLLLLYFSS